LGQPVIRPPVSNVVNLVSISKPIWAYGIETMPGILPPKDERVRRIAFAQVALPKYPLANEQMKKPEDELGRFSHGFPLLLADCFHFSPKYASLAAIGTMNKEHYVIFGAEWSVENLRELVKSNGAPIDYVFTSALQVDAPNFEFTVKIWEVKKLKERKVFTARWTAETADAELSKLCETIRMFMEWSPYLSGNALPYVQPAQPYAWAESLGTSLSFFLTDKGVLPKAHLAEPENALERLVARAALSERDALILLTALDRVSRLGLTMPDLAQATLFASPLVDEARTFLSL
jgi:hypothetical protein